MGDEQKKTTRVANAVEACGAAEILWEEKLRNINLPCEEIVDIIEKLANIKMLKQKNALVVKFRGTNDTKEKVLFALDKLGYRLGDLGYDTNTNLWGVLLRIPRLSPSD